MKPAADFKTLLRNVNSQGGEDGVIEWLFNKIEPRHCVCVEFGAWDGRTLSNTFNLVAHRGWKAIYIEADARKFRALEKLAVECPTITPICALITASGQNSLDNILERQGIPEDFDLLSIDVDGADYDIWEGLTRFDPTLVVIEHNSWFPPGYEYIDRGGRAYTGSSATSLSELAAKKGYALLGCTLTNSFFLRAHVFDSLDVRPQSVDEALDRRELCHIIINHAGEIVFSNDAMSQRLLSVIYRSPIRTLARWLSCMPTFYALGEPRANETSILRLLRSVFSSFRRRQG